MNMVPASGGDLVSKGKMPTYKHRGFTLAATTLLLFIIAAIFKIGFISHPAVVVFDEVHFGGFAQHYLKSDFFLDVHPPGAKIIIAALAYLFKLPSDFSFDHIGIDYLEAGVPYIEMRLFSALLSTLLVPIFFWTALGLNLNVEYAIMGSLMILFENAFTCQFRFIFLDSYLIFFSALAICLYVHFRNHKNAPFTVLWWVLLLGTGIAIGVATTCKWVGLFLMATVGISTLFELSNIFIYAVSLVEFGYHFMARFFGLFLIPLLIYICSFWIHFQLLQNIGPNGTSMSLLFQQSLRGGTTSPTFGPIGFGGVVTIRHMAQKSLLHSHPHLYPKNSRQQQVTLYPFNDHNNEWVVLPRDPDPYKRGTRWSEWPGTVFDNNNSSLHPFIPLRDGDRIRLLHRATMRYLHSHVVDPPISNKEHHWEVSCYGFFDGSHIIGDTNDDWIIRITDQQGNDLYPFGSGELFNGFKLADKGKDEHIASQHAFVMPIFYPRDVHEDDSNNEATENQANQHENQIDASEDTINTNEGWANADKDSVGGGETDTPDTEISVPLGLVKRNLSHDEFPIVDNDKEEFSPITHPIIARKTFFKLIHANTGCSLTSFGKNLPDWGFHQLEVTCGRDTLRSHAVFSFETNMHPSFEENPDVIIPDAVYDKLGFWSSFIELHKVMWNLNKNILAPHYFSSRPSLWPFLLRGIGFWTGSQGLSRNYTTQHDVDQLDGQERITWAHGSYKENGDMQFTHQNQQIYLIGNPVVWIGTTFAIFVYIFYSFVSFLKSHRYSKLPNFKTFSVMHPFSIKGIAFSAWALHYFPFFFMGRQLYLHHYLPAYYFGILLTTILFQAVCTKYLSVFLSRAAIVLVISIIVSVYFEFAPLTYGLDMSYKQCERIRWLSSWDFDCTHLPSTNPPSSL